MKKKKGRVLTVAELEFCVGQRYYPKEYFDQIAEYVSKLDNDRIIELVERSMFGFAEQEQYEKAAKLKGFIDRLKTEK